MNHTLTPIANCMCGAIVYSIDVFKTLSIPRTPDFVALVFKCSHCGAIDRAACELNDWHLIEAELSALQVVELGSDLIKEFVFDLDGMSSDDVINLFSYMGQPMFVEGLKDKCSCLTCERKWYSDAQNRPSY